MERLIRLFVNIANAIKAKTGSTAEIHPEDFPDAIMAISGGSDPQDMEVAVTVDKSEWSNNVMTITSTAEASLDDVTKSDTKSTRVDASDIYANGEAAGYNSGFDKGYSAGNSDGYSQGFSVGRGSVGVKAYLSSQRLTTGWSFAATAEATNGVSATSSSFTVNMPTLLWTNPSPAASFSAQTITVPNLSEYYGFLIDVTLQNTKDTYFYNYFVYDNASFNTAYFNANGVAYRRPFTVSGNTIKFEASKWWGQGNTTVNTSSAHSIPYKIYGIPSGIIF
jgi:hypothetical protein